MGVLWHHNSTLTVDNYDTNVTYYWAWTGRHWTREQVVTVVSLAYVVISILMVLLWSAYLCFDGRKSPRKDTRVIHMLAQRTMFQI